MGQARNWTPEEYEYLENSWGKVSLPYISKKLNRSESGILIKVHKLGLGAFLESGDYITVQQLYTALGYSGGSNYKNISWIKYRVLPIKLKTVKNNKFKVIYINDFWKWAEQNKSFVDFSKMSVSALGKEPTWVEEVRKNHQKQNTYFKKTPWTAYEDEQLRSALKRFKYSYAELSKMLGRTF